MEERKELYFVTSIFLNSYLLSKGFEITKTAKLDSMKVAIFYKNTDELHQAIIDYKENTELKAFVSQYHNVRNIINMYLKDDDNVI